jgi:hypothetical protein
VTSADTSPSRTPSLPDAPPGRIPKALS